MTGEKKQFVEVDGTRVFTADWVFEQMMAQSCRIDRSRRIALISIVSEIFSLIIAIVAVALQK